MPLNIMECTHFTDEQGNMKQFQIATGNGVYYLVDSWNRSSHDCPTAVTELTDGFVSALATLLTQITPGE